MRVIHFADFQKYKCGTTIRAGPPCTRSSDAPFQCVATKFSGRAQASSGRLVV
jgi:hypothetical protein